MPLVSVIIPTRNRASLLCEAINSVLAVRREGFDLEVIVVDDGSNDETPSVVPNYPVTYLRLEGGLHASAVRNAGIRVAHGEYIAFLDDDDVWLPGNITPQLRCLEEHPDYGAAHAQVILTGPDRHPWDQVLPSGPTQSGWIFDQLLTYWPQVASILVRRSVLEDVGPFDSTLRNAEDWDLMLRIARKYQIATIPEPVALFRQRCDFDDVHAFGEFPDMRRVFWRHIQQEPWPRRIRLQRILWAHRGKVAAFLVECAYHHSTNARNVRAVRSLEYALLSSPLHALKHRHLWRASSQILSNLAYVNTSTAACVNIGFLVRLGARGHGVHL